MLKARELHEAATDRQFATEEIPLGPWTSYSLKTDPKHLSFVLARYKFVAKMLEGQDYVVDIGCGDGIGIPITAQAVGHLHCVDWDKRNIEGCKRRLKHLKNVTFEHIDLNQQALDVQADAVYWIDVLEHLDPESEEGFLRNIVSFMKKESILVTGTPNISAEKYASPQSAEQHINLKSPETLAELMKRHFVYHFPFGMNDEVLHTGYAPMCHYIWSVNAHPKG